MEDTFEKFTRKRNGQSNFIQIVKEDDNKFRARGWNTTGLKINPNAGPILHQIDDKGDIFDYRGGPDYEIGFDTMAKAKKAARKLF